MEEVQSWESMKASAVKTDVPEAKPTESPAAATEEVKAESTTPEMVEPEAKTEPTIDYAAKLEEYKSKLEKAEKLGEKRLKALERISKSKGESEPEEALEEEEPQADIDSLIEKKTSERLNKLRVEESSEVIDEILNELSDNEQERALVKEVYGHEVVTSGFSRAAITKDLKKAFLLANAERFEAIAFEKAKAKVRKDNAQDKAASVSAAGATTPGREPPKVEEPTLYTDRDQKWLSYLQEHNIRHGLVKK